MELPLQDMWSMSLRRLPCSRTTNGRTDTLKLATTIRWLRTPTSSPILKHRFRLEIETCDSLVSRPPQLSCAEAAVRPSAAPFAVELA
jgi:hypothetical protein